MKIKISLIFSILISSFTYLYAEVEELVVTGTLLENTEQDSSPVDIITEEDYKNFNISNIAEISKYLSSSSGSHFQSNTLDGVDQGMNAITLRGLDQASTLLLINSKSRLLPALPLMKVKDI